MARKERKRIGTDGWLIMGGLAASGALQATGNQVSGAAMLGLVVAGSWLNMIRYMRRWTELRRQILLESTAIAFAVSLIAVVTFTAVSGVLDCDCSIEPLAVEGVMLGSLGIASVSTWLRYR